MPKRERAERTLAVILLLIAGLGYAVWPPNVHQWIPWLLTWAGVLAASLAVLWWWHRREYRPLPSELPLADRREQEWAHEIRTPLMHVQLYVQQMRQTVPEGQLEALDGLESELTRISQMMESMSVLSQVASMTPTETLDLRQWLEDALPLYREAAVTVGFALRETLESVSSVKADGQSLRQVLSNAFSNAFRYADPHAPIRVALFQDGPLWVALTITNASSPPTVPPAALTEPFVRGHDAAAGTGLGLSVVARLMDGMGGRAVCRYQDGYFSLHLLFPRSDPAHHVTSVHRS